MRPKQSNPIWLPGILKEGRWVRMMFSWKLFIVVSAILICIRSATTGFPEFSHGSRSRNSRKGYSDRSHVKKFKKGDLAGVGCLVDSCRECKNCKQGLEQYCLNGSVATYNGRDKDGSPTYGGYSDNIVVHEDFVLHVSEKLSLAAVAPLLCAGITTYSPLRYWKVGKGHKLAVLGLGGLGHMGVKFGVAFGAEVTVLSTSPSKEKDARHWELTNLWLPPIRHRWKQ